MNELEKNFSAFIDYLESMRQSHPHPIWSEVELLAWKVVYKYGVH